MTQTKISPTDTRLAFIKEVTAPFTQVLDARALLNDAGMDGTALVPDLTVEQLTEIAVKMSQAKHLGRTDRWRAECDFATLEIGLAEKNGTLTEQHARWAVLQGSIRMGWAA